MRGVDVLDQQAEYYRTFIKTRTLKVLTHFYDLALVNAQRAYKIDCSFNNYRRNKTLDLLDFRLEISEVLLNSPESSRTEGIEDLEKTMPRKYQKTLQQLGTMDIIMCLHLTK